MKILLTPTKDSANSYCEEDIEFRITDNRVYIEMAVYGEGSMLTREVGFSKAEFKRLLNAID